MSARSDPMGLRRARAATLASMLLLSSNPAHAQSPSVDREEERTALYRVGVAQADAGRWAEAVETFRKVIAIRSAPPALFTLGQAEEHLGHLVGADRTYLTALADARAGGNQEVATAAQKAIAAVEARLPHLVVHREGNAGASDVEGARVTVDGAAVSLGATSAVDPGDHEVVVRAAGARPFVRRVHAVEGQTVDVSAVLQPDGSSAVVATSPPSSQDRRAAFPLGPAILAGAGVAVGIAGYVVRAGGQSDYDAASASCPGGGCPRQSLVDDGNSGRGRMIAGTVMLGAGGAAVAGAGLWWGLSAPSTPANQVGVVLGQRDGGLRATIVGTF